jgi:poly(3-hydroxybutyrate) depolymerase
MSSLQSLLTTALFVASAANAAAGLGSYNVDPDSVSVSGLSAGGFMAAQLGVAYSGTFKTGFGVFAGGPFDCARNQAVSSHVPRTHSFESIVSVLRRYQYSTCMYNQNPSITTPTANMKSWSGNQIDPVSNLEARQVYMEVGSADTTVGPNVMAQLESQLSNFDSAPNVSYVTTSGAGHTFPTNFNGAGDNSCGTTGSPYISNCNYDGAGAALQWMYGQGLNAPNTGTLGGSVLSFAQTGSYGASGMDTTGYLYVPKSCQGGSTVCRLHVALHGCLQSYSNIQMDFVSNTGYNKWAGMLGLLYAYLDFPG